MLKGEVVARASGLGEIEERGRSLFGRASRVPDATSQS